MATLLVLGGVAIPYLSRYVQSLYYGVTIRAGGPPRPQPGSVRYAEHSRRIQILVGLLLIVSSTVYSMRWQPSFYSDLGGLPLNATERDVKSRFRRLAALHHPDKVGSTRAGDAADVNAYFVHLKTAADTLSDPVLRFAYDRFGPAVIAWEHRATAREYVWSGLTNGMAGHYLVAAGLTVALNLLGFLRWARHERWLLLAAMFVFELYAVTRVERPAVLAHLVDPVMAVVAPRLGPILPFQAVVLARSLCLMLNIILSQVGPLLTADTSGGAIELVDRKADQNLAMQQELERLEVLARGVDMEASRLCEMEMEPFRGDETVLATVRSKARDWLVQQRVQADPMVRDALVQSIRRKKMDAPAGARGTR